MTVRQWNDILTTVHTPLKPVHTVLTVCLSPLLITVPTILKDALKVTSENIEKELAKSLQLTYSFTGTTTINHSVQVYAIATISG